MGIAYNKPPDDVRFDLFHEPARQFAPYFVSVGDLNNDNRWTWS